MKIITFIWYLSILVTSLCILSLYLYEREWFETFKKIIYMLVSVLIIGIILINFLVDTNLILSIRAVLLLLLGSLVLTTFKDNRSVKSAVLWSLLYFIIVIVLFILADI